MTYDELLEEQLDTIDDWNAVGRELTDLKVKLHASGGKDPNLQRKLARVKTEHQQLQARLAELRAQVAHVRSRQWERIFVQVARDNLTSEQYQKLREITEDRFDLLNPPLTSRKTEA